LGGEDVPRYPFGNWSYDSVTNHVKTLILCVLFSIGSPASVVIGPPHKPLALDNVKAANASAID
jgi:hypothetical protein